MQMHKQAAQVQLAKRYKIAQSHLDYVGDWIIPEIGRHLILFNIMDASHHLYKSTVSYSVPVSEN